MSYDTKFINLETIITVQDRHTKQILGKVTTHFDPDDKGYEDAQLEWLVSHLLMQVRSAAQMAARKALINIGIITE